MMSLPININELINGLTVEWERIEFKECWNPEKIIHTICAFANDINNWGGGYIIIGIKEKDGRPVLPPSGLNPNQIDAFQKNLIELCHKITPTYFPIAVPVVFQGKHILILWVPGGDNRPYKAPVTLSKKPQLVPFVRRFSSTVRANSAEEQQLFQLAAKIPFDDRINHQANLENLNINLIRAFLKQIGSNLYSSSIPFVDMCIQMQIARGPKEYIKSLNIGLLLFNEQPESFFKGAKIEVIEYHDEVGDSFSEKIFTGPIHIQLRDALQYIKNNILKEEVRKIPGQAESVRFFNYPFEAIEESLVNAVYHRSYEHISSIEVNVRSDRIEILSFPGPLPPVDNKQLKKPRVVARDYRNRRIGDFLKELHLTEGRSTGIPKIRKAMEKNGSPQPIFETDDERSYFLTSLMIHPYAKKEQKSPQVSVQEKEQLKAQVELETKDVPSLSQVCPKSVPRDIVVRILQKTQIAIAITDLMNSVGQTNRTRFRKQILKPLIEAELIAMTIPDKPQSSKQKYVLTEKGRELLGRNSEPPLSASQ